MKIIQQLISSALLLLLLLIGYGVMLTWKWDPMAQTKSKAEKPKEARPATAPQVAIRLNPVPPAVLPDLKANYIFSESRSAGSKKEEEQTGKTTVGVNIKEAFYVGSIIVGDVPKGMIAYAAGGSAPAAQQAGPGLTRTGGSGMKQMLVEAGDNLGGYTVAEIQADKIVFKKDSETVEKFLKDPDKKRTTPAPQPAAAGKQAMGSKVKNIGGGGGAPGKPAVPAPGQAAQPQSQPAKMSTPVPSSARAKRTPPPPPAGLQPPPTSPPAAPPASASAPPPPPTTAREMTPEEIQEMEKELENEPTQEEVETEK